MRRNYNSPLLMIEEFAPNEYVSSCYQVKCLVGKKNYGGYGWDKWSGLEPYGKDCHNHTGECSIAQNNYFDFVNGTVSFIHENKNNGEELGGSYTDYIDNNKNNIVDAGDTIFWYTRSYWKNDERQWNHYGTVESVNPNHPNHS